MPEARLKRQRDRPKGTGKAQRQLFRDLIDGAIGALRADPPVAIAHPLPKLSDRNARALAGMSDDEPVAIAASTSSSFSAQVVGTRLESLYVMPMAPASDSPIKVRVGRQYVVDPRYAEINVPGAALQGRVRWHGGEVVTGIVQHTQYDRTAWLRDKHRIEVALASFLGAVPKRGTKPGTQVGESDDEILRRSARPGALTSDRHRRSASRHSRAARRTAPAGRWGADARSAAARPRAAGCWRK